MKTILRYNLLKAILRYNLIKLYVLFKSMENVRLNRRLFLAIFQGTWCWVGRIWYRKTFLGRAKTIPAKGKNGCSEGLGKAEEGI